MRSLCFIICAIFVSSLASAKNASDYFIEDSIKVFNVLTPINRADMLDYFKNGHTVKTTNLLNGKSYIKDLSPNVFTVSLSNSLSVRIWVSDTINVKKQIMALNYLYSIPAQDSKLEFYDYKWNRIETNKIIKLPTLADFIVIPKNSTKTKTEILKDIEVSAISYWIENENGDLKATQNLSELLGEIDYAKFAPFFMKSIHYKWNGKKFVISSKTKD